MSDKNKCILIQQFIQDTFKSFYYILIFESNTITFIRALLDVPVFDKNKIKRY